MEEPESEVMLVQLKMLEDVGMEEYIFNRGWRGPDTKGFYRKDDEFGYCLMKRDDAYASEVAVTARLLNALKELLCKGGFEFADQLLPKDQRGNSNIKMRGELCLRLQH